jgi:anti-sigma factor RsiW
MSCERLPAEDLVAWIDGECDAGEAARVAGHVASCPACAREARLLRESGALLARLPSLAPSAEFEARVVAAARNGATATAPRGRLVLLRPRVAAAAAAAVVAAAAGVWWLTASRQEAGDVLTAREEAAVVEDLAVISNLDALQQADAGELARLADDLDVIDALGPDSEGG